LSAGCCGLPAAAVQGQHCSPQQHPGWIYTSDFCAPQIRSSAEVVVAPTCGRKASSCDPTRSYGLENNLFDKGKEWGSIVCVMLV
jgi:hypothetical protein